MEAGGWGPGDGKRFLTHKASTQADAANNIGRAARGVNDGNGFVFISHTGEVFPSGFLPVSGGNVKETSLVEIYRDSMLFRAIRDYALLSGKCGVCDYLDVCGGSRSRAYAVYGDLFASDPFCVYVPPQWKSELAAGQVPLSRSRSESVPVPSSQIHQLDTGN